MLKLLRNTLIPVRFKTHCLVCCVFQRLLPATAPFRAILPSCSTFILVIGRHRQDMGRQRNAKEFSLLPSWHLQCLWHQFYLPLENCSLCGPSSCWVAPLTPTCSSSSLWCSVLQVIAGLPNCASSLSNLGNKSLPLNYLEWTLLCPLDPKWCHSSQENGNCIWEYIDSRP